MAPRAPRKPSAPKLRGLRVKYAAPADLELGQAFHPPEPDLRPRTRAECANGIRPCPFFSCRYSLRVNVVPRTGLLQFPQGYPDEVPDERPSCALDVAEEGGLGQDEVGAHLGISGEFVRQLTERALGKIRLALLDEKGEVK